jgi:hypothetical protein
MHEGETSFGRPSSARMLHETDLGLCSNMYFSALVVDLVDAVFFVVRAGAARRQAEVQDVHPQKRRRRAEEIERAHVDCKISFFNSEAAHSESQTY